MKPIFVSDCEGPISINDNAYELASNFIPCGGKIFSLISKYDDILSVLPEYKDYTVGSTLKFILPFLKAYDVTDKHMQDFSSRTLILIPNIKDTIKHISKLTSAFIVSTSYEHYIRAICKVLDFPFENTFCTKLTIDHYLLKPAEKKKLKSLTRELCKMPMIQIPDSFNSLDNFDSNHKETIFRLKEIFTKEFAELSCKNIFSEIVTIGGEQKAEAIKKICNKTKTSLSNILYVGDSITDLQAFRLVRENGGLTISFNGNNYALKQAEIAVISENSLPVKIIADIFINKGKKCTIESIKNWLKKLNNKNLPDSLLTNKSLLSSNSFHKVEFITEKNIDILSKESSYLRKKVRGQNIGELG